MHSTFRSPEVAPIGASAAADREADLWYKLQADLYAVRTALTGLNGLVGGAEQSAVTTEELAALLRLISDRAKLADEHATALFHL